jgi:hypothetical protein
VLSAAERVMFDGQRISRKVKNRWARYATKFDRYWNRHRIRTADRTRNVALNPWQEAFCQWQAGRMGLATSDVVDRFRQSLSVLRGGHRSPNFSRYAAASHQLFLPFASDRPAEVVDLYEFHAYLHFLAHLGHPPVLWPTNYPVFERIDEWETVAICDFGCGLAHQSVTLAREMRARGKRVTLHLCDIPSINLEFLDWFCAREGFEAETWKCTAAAPFPPFPPCVVLIATEILEHVHDPVHYVDHLDRLVAPGGAIVTNTSMHKRHFGHVSPDLSAARRRFRELGYAEPIRDRIFRKPRLAS